MVVQRSAALAAVVESTREHLQQLDRDMDAVIDDDDSDGDVDLIQVVEVLELLSEERQRMHAQLEAATIHLSGLRFNLETLASVKQREHEDLVVKEKLKFEQLAAALKNQIDGHFLVNDKLGKEVASIDQVNARLSTEYEESKARHAQLVQDLNNEMSNKANVQITCNQTMVDFEQMKLDIMDTGEATANMRKAHAIAELDWAEELKAKEAELEEVGSLLKVSTEDNQTKINQEIELQEQLQKTVEELAQAKAAKQTLDGGRGLMVDMVAEARAALYAVSDEVAGDEAKVRKLRADVEHDTATLEQETSRAHETVEDTNARLAKARKEEEELIAKKEQLTSSLMRQKGLSAEATEMIATIEQQLANDKKELQDLHLATANLNGEIASQSAELAREIKQYRMKEDALNNTLEMTSQQRQHEVETSRKLQEQSSREVETFKERKAAALKELQAVNDNIAAEKDALAELTDRLETRDQELADLADRLVHLDADIASTVQKIEHQEQDLRARIAYLEGDLKLTVDREETQKAENEQSAKHIEELGEQLAAQEATHEASQAEYADSEALKWEHRTAIEELSGKLTQIGAEVRATKVDFQDYSERSERKARADSLEIARLEQKLGGKVSLLEQFTHTNGRLGSINEDFTREHNRLSARLTDANQAKLRLLERLDESRALFQKRTEDRHELERAAGDRDRASLRDIHGFKRAEWKNRIHLLQLHGQLEMELKSLNTFVTNLVSNHAAPLDKNKA